LQKKTKSKGDFVPAISNLSDKEIGYSARKIIDKDGDGVEDNVHLTHAELERYRVPHVFGTVEEMHNTHNGELPGHIRYGEDNLPGRHASHLFVDPYEKERNASKYPMPTQGGENSKAAADADAKDKAEAAKDEKKNAEPEPKKEGLTEEAKEAKPEEEKKEEAAAKPKKEEAKEAAPKEETAANPAEKAAATPAEVPKEAPTPDATNNQQEAAKEEAKADGEKTEKAAAAEQKKEATAEKTAKAAEETKEAKPAKEAKL
jgi:hypothetical protein